MLKRRFDPGLLAAAVLPLIGILPAIGDGIIRTADGPIHMHRMFAMTQLLRQGNLWPRWVPYFHLGYGYPVFNFYPPGAHYVGGLLGLLGIGAPTAFTLLLIAAWVLGSVGVYALARRFLPLAAAILAAALWAYAPTRLHEVWSQGSVTQMMAGAFVPWILLGLIRAAQEPTRRNAVLLGVPFAGVILCHLPITLLTALFVGPGALLLPLGEARKDRASFRRRFFAVAGGLLLGLGLCAIFWLPMAWELHDVWAWTSSGAPMLLANFMTLPDLVQPTLPIDLTDLRLVMPPTLGPLAVILALIGMAALIARKRYAPAAILAVGMVGMIFLTQEVSAPLWLRIPFLPQLRFPWRVLRVGIVFVAIVGSASVLLLPGRWRSIGAALAVIAVIVAGLPWTYPTREFVNWENLSALDEIQMELTDRVWGTTSYNEFQPNWGETVFLDPPPEPEEYVTNPLRVVVNRTDMIRQWPDLQVEQLDTSTVRIVAATERQVRFRQYYFPGWEATLDGQPVTIYPEEEIGLLSVDVPPGEHVVALRYAGTPMQAIAALMTVASIALAGVLLTRSGSVPPSPALPPQRGEGSASPEFSSPLVGEELEEGGTRGEVVLAWGVTIGVVIFALVNALILAPIPSWLRHQSPPDSPAYAQTPVHQRFGDAYELLGYTLNQDTVAPGGALDITVYWRTLRDTTGTDYRPVIQLVNLTRTGAWALNLDNEIRYMGLPTDRFLSDAIRLDVSGDIPPYANRIQVQLIEQNTGEVLTLPDGADHLLLDPLIRVQGSDPAAARTLDVVIGGGLRLQCLSARREGDDLRVDLYWRVESAVSRDGTLMLHALDANGELAQQGDGPPLDGNYPTSLWLPGQNLTDSFTLPYDPAIVSLALGVYAADDLQRWPIMQDGQPVPDNRLILPVAEANCLP